MTYIHTIILGIIEGLTEFLPISSTGHMIIASNLLNIAADDFSKSFEIFIQLGPILAVFVLYGKRLLSNFKLITRVFVAFLPTAILGLIFYKLIKTYLLGNIWVVLWSLFIGGVLILLFEKREKREAHANTTGYTVGRSKIDANNANDNVLANMSYKQAFLIGIAQSVAMIPGVSRSAATIIGGRLLGISRVLIVEFSFMLAIPTMIAASGLDLVKNYKLFSGSDFGMLGVGFLVSFVVAMLAIKVFLKYIQKNNFNVFGWYRIIISIIFAIIFLRP
jgi:undecaprenyl-diphosphatase